MIILLKVLQFIFYLVFRLPPVAAIQLMHFAGEITFRIARLTPVKKMTVENMGIIFPGKMSGNRPINSSETRPIRFSRFSAFRSSENPTSD